MNRLDHPTGRPRLIRLFSFLIASLLGFSGSSDPAAFADEIPTAQSPAAGDETTVIYNRDIRPILAENCFACHGPDSASREASLRLDQREAAIESGVLIAGDPEASELIRRIHLPEDEDEAMPPPTGHKRLSDHEKELLTRWIAQGAMYQPHWSFITPVRPELPPVSKWRRKRGDGHV